MNVKAKIVADFKDKGRLKAIATVCLNGQFLITGVRIVELEKGLSVFMPSRQSQDGEYKDVCFPITPPLHQQIRETVLEAYRSQPMEASQPEPAQ